MRSDPSGGPGPGEEDIELLHGRSRETKKSEETRRDGSSERDLRRKLNVLAF